MILISGSWYLKRHHLYKLPIWVAKYDINTYTSLKNAGTWNYQNAIKGVKVLFTVCELLIFWPSTCPIIWRGCACNVMARKVLFFSHSYVRLWNQSRWIKFSMLCNVTYTSNTLIDASFWTVSWYQVRSLDRPQISFLLRFSSSLSCLHFFPLNASLSFNLYLWIFCHWFSKATSASYFQKQFWKPCCDFVEAVVSQRLQLFDIRFQPHVLCTEISPDFLNLNETPQACCAREEDLKLLLKKQWMRGVISGATTRCWELLQRLSEQGSFSSNAAFIKAGEKMQQDTNPTEVSGNSTGLTA